MKINKRTISFTKEELEKHEHDIRELAYRNAAVCTLRKLELFKVRPLGDVLDSLIKYRKYLTKTYNIAPIEYIIPR
jgi:hypothetical protein